MSVRTKVEQHGVDLDSILCLIFQEDEEVVDLIFYGVLWPHKFGTKLLGGLIWMCLCSLPWWICYFELTRGRWQE